MIVVETLLGEVFSQIPDVNVDGKDYKVKYHWGGQDDLNLYMQNEDGNKTPLIWLIQDKTRIKSTEASRRIKLLIAKSSEHKDNMNPLVWETEFKEILDPLLEKVLLCFKRTGLFLFVNQEYDVYREANYSDYLRDENGRATDTKTIDHWNVIWLEADIIFKNIGNCIPQIDFNI